MAATKNNQWWKLRSKHGRDKTFESPDRLWESCVEYFEKTDERKWYKTEFKTESGILKECLIPTQTPYTLTGLCIFLDIDENTWQRYRKDESYKDFWAVVKQVDNIIYTQKFEGATVGVFNANIIARDLGLSEKQDLTVDTIKPIEFTIIKNKE